MGDRWAHHKVAVEGDHADHCRLSGIYMQQWTATVSAIPEEAAMEDVRSRPLSSFGLRPSEMTAICNIDSGALAMVMPSLP